MSNSFDERAATWDDDPAKVQRAWDVAEAVADAVPLTRSTRLLEYGAGTGLVTQALRARVGPVTLVDTSAGMREVVHDKIAAGTITDARVWDLDLANQPAPDEDFDLIVTSMVLHHVTDLQPVLAGFAALLAPDGRLCIVDLDKEDGSFHAEGFAGHHGFDREELEMNLRRAGFTDVTFTHCHDLVRDQTTYPLFLATARLA